MSMDDKHYISCHHMKNMGELRVCDTCKLHTNCCLMNGKWICEDCWWKYWEAKYGQKLTRRY